MTDLLNELLVLMIVGVYFRMMLVLAFLAGQLLIFVVEALADYIERRQSRAHKQTKAVQNRKKVKRKGACCTQRNARREHQQD